MVVQDFGGPVKRILFAAACLASASLWAQAPPAAPPKPAAATPLSSTITVGEMAPNFTLPSTAGGKVTLADFRGKKTVVLAFFPAAFTGG